MSISRNLMKASGSGGTWTANPFPAGHALRSSVLTAAEFNGTLKNQINATDLVDYSDVFRFQDAGSLWDNERDCVYTIGNGRLYAGGAVNIDQFTISLWFQYTSVTPGTLYRLFGDSSSAHCVFIQIFGSALQIAVGYDSGASPTTDWVTIPTSSATEWMYLVIGSNPVDGKYYVSCSTESADMTYQLSGVVGPSSGSVMQFIGYPTQTLRARISQFRLYDEFIPESELNYLYDADFLTIPLPDALPVANPTASLLLNGNGSVIEDATGKEALTVTGAVISNATKKYGAGSLDLTSASQITTATTDSISTDSVFTIEFWANFSDLTGNQTIIDSDPTAGFYIAWVAGSWYIADNGSNVITSSHTPVVGVWNHYAVVSDGVEYRFYRDGVKRATSSATLSSTSLLSWSIGSRLSGGNPFKGYIDDLKITKGEAKYNDATFAIPLEATVALGDVDPYIADAKVVLNGESGVVEDALGKQTIIPNGTTVSNFKRKFGTGSLLFNGTVGGGVKDPSHSSTAITNPDYAINTQDFTFEGWVNKRSAGFEGVFQHWRDSTTQATTVETLALVMRTSSNKFQVYANNTAYDSSALWVADTWYHFALVRRSGVTTLYIDGVSVFTTTDTVNYGGTTLVIGEVYQAGYDLDGHIDDFRFTKNVARYTANFTPPVKTLPLI